MRRLMILTLMLLTTNFVWAEASSNINFNFENAELNSVLKEYAKASGQKFIVDPNVHGRITIMNRSPIAITEAFDQLSAALALNGIGISQQDDTMILMPARTLQRDNIEVVKEVPPAKPERMYTWVISLKYISANDVNTHLRILASKDGELTPYPATNQIVVSDWSSNLQRIGKVIAQIDIPTAQPPTPPTPAKSTAKGKEPPRYRPN